ncbi:AAA family ATPase [Alistipes sp.]|uniref:AAA family ATPase n=1 Tax=Alistipes sp. TaxID=1872444 RepID=UPI003AAC4A9E
MRTTTPSPRLTPEQFRERLYRRIRTAIPTRYKLPATEQEARRMLTQCYLGELYKRGSLPVPAQLLPRPEAIPGRPGAGGHFPGQGGGWQGENGCGGGGRVSGGSGCTGRGTEEGGRAGSRREDDDSTRASDRGTGSRRQESEWAGYEGSEREAIGNDARLDPGTAARIAKAARWLTGDHRPGLLLYGTVGSGKSTLARAICELIGILHDSPLRSERLAVARTSAPELVELKAAREVRAAADSEELFARLRGAPMLLIDDLGVEATAVRSWGNCLTPVIDLLYYRYDRRLFTIVTSNLDQEAIEATYGVRIADRMAEMFDRIGHAGPSYRR